ncbi:MAG: glycosyltransferase family 2 protein [Deltaproteobacteria bacterium]|nr:MAG: glycosyltransferase family 2 protein [Deltaproteobacteria bacterium]TMB45854.1 MAG: glycosyltransferase family 2 protein [Deltaproteobacteria bacterium]
MSIAAIGGYLVNEPSDAEFAHVGRTLVSSAHPQPAPHRMTPGPRPRVSLVTVTFNAAGFISPFCEAVSRLSYPALEVLIVDNASHDGTAAVLRRALPRATVIEARRNGGFAAGCNLGAAAASGDVLFFLNPDTRPPPEAVEPLCRPVFERRDVGAAGCKLVYPDGRLQSAGGVIGEHGFCRHRGQGEHDRGQYDSEAVVDYVPGAALAIRRGVFRELGGFHEGYFPGFYEDVELCVRLRRRGYRVLCVAAPTIEHLENQSIGPTLPYSVRRNRMLFLARNADPEHPYRALGREASRLYRAHVRPLLAALLGAHPWKLRDAWRDWRPAMPGDLAGFALALLAARRTGPHGAPGPDRSRILCSPAAPDGQDR